MEISQSFKDYTWAAYTSVAVHSVLAFAWKKYNGNFPLTYKTAAAFGIVQLAVSNPTGYLTGRVGKMVGWEKKHPKFLASVIFVSALSSLYGTAHAFNRMGYSVPNKFVDSSFWTSVAWCLATDTCNEIAYGLQTGNI